MCDCNLKIPESFTDEKAQCDGPPDLSGTALVTLAGKTFDCGELNSRSHTEFEFQRNFYQLSIT